MSGRITVPALIVANSVYSPPPSEPIEPEAPPVQRYRCLADTCPVRTSHPSGICAYHGRRGAFA